jgi:SAM-dependent methyltransferase
VLAFNLLHLLADLDQALAAIAHTLRPGGLFISKTPCIAEMNPLITHLAVPLMRAVGKAPPLLRFDEAQLHSAIRRAGLEVIATERHGTRGKDVRAFVVARKPAAVRA